MGEFRVFLFQSIKIITEVSFPLTEIDLNLFQFLYVDSLELLNFLSVMFFNEFFIHLAGLDLEPDRINVSLDGFLKPKTVNPHIPNTVLQRQYFMSLVLTFPIDTMHTKHLILGGTVQTKIVIMFQTALLSHFGLQ